MAKRKRKQYGVYLGYRADIWGHRGYRVCGGVVTCDGLRQARRVVMASLPEGSFFVRFPDGGLAAYTTREKCRRDTTGEGADATIYEVSDE